jgi:hypothetical protein
MTLLRFDAQPALYDFVQLEAAVFVAGSGPAFGPGYHLNYWMSQDWGTGCPGSGCARGGWCPAGRRWHPDAAG